MERDFGDAQNIHRKKCPSCIVFCLYMEHEMPKKITLCSQFHYLYKNIVHYLIAHVRDVFG